MTKEDDQIFLIIWPKCFVTFLAIIEILATIVLFLTELGNVAANFWTTNVFAGGWCGLVILIHVLTLLAAGCCKPGAKTAFSAVIIAALGIFACAALIGFDAIFIAKPTTCILTPSCSLNAASNTTFSYNFQQSFFAVFNNWTLFQSYGESQTKFVFQAIQLGVGALCFLLCIIYLIIYYVTKNTVKKNPVQPTPDSQTEQGYSGLSSSYMPPQQPTEAFVTPQPSYMAPQQPTQPFITPPPSYMAPQQPTQPFIPPQPNYYPSLPQSYPQDFNNPQPNNFIPPPPPPPVPVMSPQRQFIQPAVPAWRPPPYVPQVPPGTIPWNSNRRN